MGILSGRKLIEAGERPKLLAQLSDGSARVIRKKARSVAIQLDFPFAVETEHGVISAEPGDWLVTNHPDDDPGSDMWPVSRERMAQTYEDA